MDDIKGMLNNFKCFCTSDTFVWGRGRGRSTVDAEEKSMYRLTTTSD